MTEFSFFYDILDYNSNNYSSVKLALESIRYYP